MWQVQVQYLVTFVQTVFNLSHKVLTETEINVLEKGLDYAPIQKKINKPELRKDFSEFCQRMRIKWYTQSEPAPQFSEVPCFKISLCGDFLIAIQPSKYF